MVAVAGSAKTTVAAVLESIFLSPDVKRKYPIAVGTSPNQRTERPPLVVRIHSGFWAKRNGTVMSAATPNEVAVNQISCAPAARDLRLTTLNTAKPNPAMAAKRIPSGLNSAIPFAVPTRMIPRIVTDVPRYQLLEGFSPITK